MREGFVYFVGMLIALFAVSTVLSMQISADCKKQCTHKISDIEFVKEATEKFIDSHNYTEYYNCINYSKDFKETMKNLGIKAEVVGGKENDSKIGHLWNEITFHIDPQTGEVKIYDDYETYSDEYLEKYR